MESLYTSLLKNCIQSAWEGIHPTLDENVDKRVCMAINGRIKNYFWLILAVQSQDDTFRQLKDDLGGE